MLPFLCSAHTKWYVKHRKQTPGTILNGPRNLLSRPARGKQLHDLTRCELEVLVVFLLHGCCINLLDSVVDRVSEMLVLLGLLIFYLKGDSFEGAIIVYLTVTGSVIVSYLRARSEGLGLENLGGIMTRPERVTILGLGLIIGHWFGFLLLIVLVIVAGLAIFTTGQRFFHIWKTPHSGDSE